MEERELLCGRETHKLYEPYHAKMGITMCNAGVRRFKAINRGQILSLDPGFSIAAGAVLGALTSTLKTRLNMPFLGTV